MGEKFEVEGKLDGVGDLTPGATPRRWEPEGGLKRHRERIHKESRFADEHKNLPFTFSKPNKPRRHSFFECENCGRVISAPVNTVGVICNGCKQFTKVKEVDGN